MDQFMVDVTDIPCSVDDEVVLIGAQGDACISMEEFSNQAYSFNYEIPCRIQSRVARVYRYNNEILSARGLNKGV